MYSVHVQRMLCSSEACISHPWRVVGQARAHDRPRSSSSVPHRRLVVVSRTNQLARYDERRLSCTASHTASSDCAVARKVYACTCTFYTSFHQLLPAPMFLRHGPQETMCSDYFSARIAVRDSRKEDFSVWFALLGIVRQGSDAMAPWVTVDAAGWWQGFDDYLPAGGHYLL